MQIWQHLDMTLLFCETSNSSFAFRPERIVPFGYWTIDCTGNLKRRKKSQKRSRNPGKDTRGKLSSSPCVVVRMSTNPSSLQIHYKFFKISYRLHQIFLPANCRIRTLTNAQISMNIVENYTVMSLMYRIRQEEDQHSPFCNDKS